jgi:hypothetical protein
MARGTEIEFEKRLRAIISKDISGSGKDFVLLENKDVFDIIICRNSNVPKIFFIEVKHHTSSNNRIGFGNQDGSGFQPELLLKRPEYFEQNLRWIFGRDNDNGYYVLETKDCLRYLAGDTMSRKQNNFQLKLFDEIVSFDKAALVKYLKEWIMER